MTKKRTIKSTLSLLLALVMLVSLLPAMTIPAHAASTPTYIQWDAGKAYTFFKEKVTGPTGTTLYGDSFEYLESHYYSYGPKDLWTVTGSTDTGETHTFKYTSGQYISYALKAKTTVTIDLTMFVSADYTQQVCAGIYDQSTGVWEVYAGTPKSDNNYSDSTRSQLTEDISFTKTDLVMEEGDVILLSAKTSDSDANFA